MPPKKKIKVAVNNGDNEVAVADHPLDDVLEDILCWLLVQEIMSSRSVCKKWKEAARKTIAPPTDFVVNSVKNYNAMNVMTMALPNLQQITIGFLSGVDHKWSDGEDPDRRPRPATNRTALDIEIISNFSKLRELEINCAFLNGRYPVLFNSFPLLQKLSITCCPGLKWDLEMLSGFPLLKELDCESNHRSTGSIGSLRVLKDTLEKVRIRLCFRIEGNFMDLSDFPLLKKLYLLGTSVTGDIRDIGENDFSSLEELILPNGVYGGHCYELQRISDAPDLGRAVYTFNKQRPSLKNYHWLGTLSTHSPDWYRPRNREHLPPFYINIVEAGSRGGYRWTTDFRNGSCEVNWLDPEPDRESSDYEEYIVKLEKIQDEIGMYRGFYQPPTKEEYHRLVEG